VNAQHRIIAAEDVASKFLFLKKQKKGSTEAASKWGGNAFGGERKGEPSGVWQGIFDGAAQKIVNQEQAGYG